MSQPRTLHSSQPRPRNALLAMASGIARRASRPLALGFALASTTALIPVLAQASGDGDGGGTKEMIWQTANLVLLLGVVVYAARKPVVEFFSSRRGQISNDLDQAASLLQQAEERNSRLQRKVIELASEVEDIHEATRGRTEEECERMLAEARRSAERIRADATDAVAQELTRAKRELREEAADIALDLAAGILKEQVAESDRERLLDEFITRVESASR